MHIPRSRGGRTALVATVLGSLLLLVGGYLVLFDESSKAPTSAEGLTAGTQPFQPGEDEIPESLEDLVNPAKTGSGSFASGSGLDPFAGGSASDTTLHKVVIKFESDGGMYAGWLYRTKGGEGVRVASKTLTVSRSVRGALPVAKAAVRVLNSASYASCTIYVDGVAVDTQTARGENYLTVCFG